MSEVICLLIGLLIGAAVGYLLGHLRSGARLAGELEAERQSRVTFEIRFQEAQKRLEEQQHQLDDWVAKIRNDFDAIAARALQGNSEQYLARASDALNLILSDAKGDLGKRHDQINESLRRCDEHTRAIEKARQDAYVSLKEQIAALSADNRRLQEGTDHLVNSLRDPRVRGRWGEITLHRAVELAGMSEHCDFTEQKNVEGTQGVLRPDMVIHLPGGRTVVVDVKTTMEGYLGAVAATDDAARQQCLARHAKQVRGRMNELSNKDYWSHLDGTPEFVVLFIPGESFFSAAIEIDRDLIEDAIKRKVVLASPTTLIALLRAIAYGWRQEQLAENAKKIGELGREIYDRLRTMTGYWDKLGESLNRAVSAYNEAARSLESRVLPSGRKFRELKAAVGDDIPLLEPLDHTARRPEISPPDEAS